jgi:hypothetical protein
MWSFVIETLFAPALPDGVLHFLPFSAGYRLLDAGADFKAPVVIADQLSRPMYALIFGGYALSRSPSAPCSWPGGTPTETSTESPGPRPGLSVAPHGSPIGFSSQRPVAWNARSRSTIEANAPLRRPVSIAPSLKRSPRR